MTIPNYTRVRLLSDKYQAEGVHSGQIGYIIEVYDPEVYEVEFSDHEGITIAQIVIPREELEIAEEPAHAVPPVQSPDDQS